MMDLLIFQCVSVRPGQHGQLVITNVVLEVEPEREVAVQTVPEELPQ